MEIRLRAEVARCNAFSRGLHSFFCVFELDEAAPRGDGYVSVQVLKGERTHSISPFLLSSERVNGEL